MIGAQDHNTTSPHAAGQPDSLTIWGKIAVGNKYMTQAQWDECLALFNQHAGRMSMGAILMSKRYVSEKYLSQINTKVAKFINDQAHLGQAHVGDAPGGHAPHADAHAPEGHAAETHAAGGHATDKPISLVHAHSPHGHTPPTHGHAAQAPVAHAATPPHAPTTPKIATRLGSAPAATKVAPPVAPAANVSKVISVSSPAAAAMRAAEELVEPEPLDPDALIPLADGEEEVASEDAPRTWKPSDAEWVESSDVHASQEKQTEAGADAIPLEEDEAAAANGENGENGAAHAPGTKPRIKHDGYQMTEWGRKHQHQKKEVRNAEGEVLENAVDEEERMFSSITPGQLDPLAVEMIKLGLERGASDIHLASGSPPFFRIHGGLVMTDLPKLTAKQARDCVLGFMTDEQQQKYLHHHDLDFSFVHPVLGRFRVNALEQFRGPDIIFRCIPSKVPTLDELGLPPTLAKFTEWHQGLVLVTGPAGCGKSTTAAALINLINRKRKDHVITIEDPVEFMHESLGCNVTQRQVPTNTKTFAAALRAALREDPDVIQIGEMRDLETMTMAIRAAETGHLVIGTLQTRNAARTVDRVIDVFPTEQQAQIRTMLSESLRGIISQQLVPLADGTGRACALEVLFANTAVSNLIRDNKTYQLSSMMQTGYKHGMRLMDDSLDELVKNGRITKEEANKWAIDVKRFK